MESNPEPFKPHYKQLLQLFGTVLQDVTNPTALYYCILTFTAITAYTGTEEMVGLERFSCFCKKKKFFKLTKSDNLIMSTQYCMVLCKHVHGVNKSRFNFPFSLFLEPDALIDSKTDNCTETLNPG